MKSIKCKYCAITWQDLKIDSKFYASHTKWCDKNPNRKKYLKSLKKSRKAITSESIENMKKKIKDRWKEGSYNNVDHSHFKGKKHSQKSRKNMSDGSSKSKHRRLRKNPILYKGIMLDSRWELLLATRLDELGIEWIRPEPLKWFDSNKKLHHYFPDFYLPKHEIYLDPKNPHAYNVQKEKMKIICELYNVKILKTEKECLEFSI